MPQRPKTLCPARSFVSLKIQIWSQKVLKSDGQRTLEIMMSGGIQNRLLGPKEEVKC